VWVLKRLRTLARERPWSRGDKDVQNTITSFANQSGAGRMDYASRVAACKVGEDWIGDTSILNQTRSREQPSSHPPAD
jgi:hypothetical protein